MPTLQTSEHKMSTVVTTKDNLNALPIADGQTVYEKDNGQAYFDWGGTRISLSSVVFIDPVSGDFPEVGRDGVIYVRNGKLYKYDTTLQSYNELAKDSFVWGTF